MEGQPNKPALLAALLKKLGIPASGYKILEHAGGFVEVVATRPLPCKCCQCRGPLFGATEATKVFQAKCEAYGAVWKAQAEARRLIAKLAIPPGPCPYLITPFLDCQP